MSSEKTGRNLPSPIFLVDKEGAALRQLESAIMLWFNHPDPVSIHTLAVASNDCYGAMVENSGKAESKVQEWIKTLPIQQRRAIRYAQNFYKHGFKGLNGRAASTPLHAELLIIEAASFHEILFGRPTPLMLAFTVRFTAENPHIVRTTQQLTVRDILQAYAIEGIKVDDILKSNRQEFLAWFLARTAHAESRYPN
jgi:hypothetical protein